MGRQAVVVLYVLALVAVVVGADHALPEPHARVASHADLSVDLVEVDLGADGE